MGLSTNTNSGTVFDQIQTLQKRIDECRAACELYRDKSERISEHLSATRQINSGIDNPDFVDALQVQRYEEACSNLREMKAKLRDSLHFLRMILQKIKRTSIECVQEEYGCQFVDIPRDNEV